jgi:hypothetical protein
MIVYGYAKEYYYTGEGMLLIKCRIPVIHGPYNYNDFKGTRPKRYIIDKDLPFYPSVILPHLPIDGDVVALESTDEGKEHFIVIGLMGSSYSSGMTNLGGI